MSPENESIFPFSPETHSNFPLSLIIDSDLITANILKDKWQLSESLYTSAHKLKQKVLASWIPALDKAGIGLQKTQSIEPEDAKNAKYLTKSLTKIFL